MNNEINQEYVNENMISILDFMVMCRPELASNRRNWRSSLLKDYKTKLEIVIAYHKYNEGQAMMNKYNRRIDSYYDKFEELERQELNQKNEFNNLKEQAIMWRDVKTFLSEHLIDQIGKSEYDRIIMEESKFPSYYGL